MLRGGTARGGPGAASSSGQVPLVDRPLPRGKGEVALSLFAFLFSEMVQYAQKRSSNIGELEGKLEAIGMGETAPFNSADPRADVNRRVEFQALG